MNNQGDVMAGVRSGIASIHEAQREAGRRMRAAADAQIALPHLLSGDATWEAMQRAINDLVERAPKDHDVLLQAFDLSILNVQFMEPHTFLFEGIDGEGNQAGFVCHFTQVVVRVVYLPKRGPDRVITGFATAK
jgi:hypothetical protein